MGAPYTKSRVLDVPGIRHGFFGREGGRSTGTFATNNMSIALGDNQDIVISNRSSAASQMGDFGMKDLVLFRQVHSTRVVTLTERHDVSVAVVDTYGSCIGTGLLSRKIPLDCSAFARQRAAGN